MGEKWEGLRLADIQNCVTFTWPRLVKHLFEQHWTVDASIRLSKNEQLVGAKLRQLNSQNLLERAVVGLGGCLVVPRAT